MERGELKRGFKPLEHKLKDTKGLKSIRDCNNCFYMYSDGESKEEYCHNNGVTSYDMCEESNKKYCTFYLPPWSNKEREEF